MIHTLTELCYDLSIAKGSRTRLVRRLNDRLGIVGKKKYFKGHSHKVLTFTDEQYKYALEEYPKIQRKKRDTKPLNKKEKKMVKDNFSRAQEPSENRKKGYYMTIQDIDMVNAFQGRAV